MQVSLGSSAAICDARCISRGISSSEPPISSSERRAWTLCSIALAGDDIGLVEEPEAAMLLQDFSRSVEVARVAQDFREARVVDLRNVDRRVPGREQGRGADAGRDLGGQRVHFVAEQGPRIGVGVEVVAPRSEEHTSELQSQSNLVCRLLLEKK